jgi:hypothetical protein
MIIPSGAKALVPIAELDVRAKAYTFKTALRQWWKSSNLRGALLPDRNRAHCLVDALQRFSGQRDADRAHVIRDLFGP